jgi:hypothetical protein
MAFRKCQARTIEAYTLENVKVIPLSPRIVLLLYKATCKATGDWAGFCSRAQYISDLWVDRNGHWMGLFSQDMQAK